MENTEMKVYGAEFELTEEQQATELDSKIKFYANAAWMNLVESCKCLKKMRDTKLYEQLGYSSFGDYTEKSLNIKERQAYTYISTIEKQGETFLQLNASLGITKLALLSDIPAPDRQEFVESHDLAGMTVKEVEELVAQNNEKGEQIEMLTDTLNDVKEERDDANADLEKAEKRIEELEEELEQERNRPTEVAVQEPDAETLSKIREEAKAEAKKEAEEAFKAEKKELKKKLNAEKEKAVSDATQKAEKDIEDLKQKFSSAEDAATEAMRRNEELQKQLAVSSSPETTKFTFFFEALQTDYGKLMESLEVIKKENPEVAEKYAGAIGKYQGIISDKLKELGFNG